QVPSSFLLVRIEQRRHVAGAAQSAQGGTKMAPATATVEWVGEDGFEEYHGLHGDKPVTLRAGEPAELSSEIAGYLGEHFAHLVSIDGKPPAKKSKPAAAPSDQDAKPDLEKL